MEVGGGHLILPAGNLGSRNSSDDPTNLYILNLAFCDLLFCIFVIPLYTLNFIFKGWPLGNTICVASAVMKWAGLGINNWLLSLIAFSRLVIIKSPSIGMKIFKGQAAKIPLMSVWLFVIISALEDLLSVRYNNLYISVKKVLMEFFRTFPILVMTAKLDIAQG